MLKNSFLLINIDKSFVYWFRSCQDERCIIILRIIFTIYNINIVIFNINRISKMLYNFVLFNWVDGYNMFLKGIKINFGSLYMY